MSRKSGEEDLGAAGLLLRTYSAGPVSPICYRSIRPRAGYALQPSMTRKPQLQEYSIRVWPYETFIVSASSSSGQKSGQNLEVLYIINADIETYLKYQK